MPDSLPTRHSLRRRRVRKNRRRKVKNGLFKRGWTWAVLVVVAAALVAGWIGIRGLQAKTELEAAQTKISVLKTQALALDIPGATKTLGEISDHTKNAMSLTDDVVWRAGELVPMLGGNLKAVRQLAAVTDDIVSDVAAPLISVAGSVDPASLAPKDGAINLQPIIDALPELHQANAGLKHAIVAVDGIDSRGTVAQVVAARAKIAGMLAELAPVLGTLDSAVPLVPPSMGSDAPRTYVIMFQNPAEARALGGTALSFALMTVDKGRIALVKTVAAGFANFNKYQTAVVPAPDGVDALYPGGIYGTYIPNATLRPSFTNAAEITQEMWRRQFGSPVDGIISIDPIALSYVLRAMDPITLSSGDVITSKSIVPLLLNDVYLRFNSGDAVEDNLAQDKIYGEAVGATFSALTSGSLNPKVLIAALMQGWNEHRVLYWSAHKNEQSELAAIGLNGEPPVSDATTERVGVYFQDNVGSKLNYYLQQSVHLAAASCREDGRQNLRVTVDLGSAVPANADQLPPAIIGQWEREGLRPGVQRMIVTLYAPPGSQIVGGSVNGQPVALESLHDVDYPVGKMIVKVEPGATVTLSYDLIAGQAGKRALDALVTPMVNKTVVDKQALDCATVPAA